MTNASPKEKVCIDFAFKLKAELETKSINENRSRFNIKKWFGLDRKISNSQVKQNSFERIEFKVSRSKTLTELWSRFGFYGDDLLIAECINLWISVLHGKQYNIGQLIETERIWIQEDQKRLKEEAARSGEMMVRKNYGNIIENILVKIDTELGVYNT